jgi:aspartate racemase
MRHIQPLISIIFFLSISCSCPVSDQENQSAQRQVLGILGGMGPEATADLYKNIVRLTPAVKDQEHIPTVIYSLPQTPDRVASIMSSDTAIYAYLREGVKLLEESGAKCIAIPCNTVHYFYDFMDSQTDVPIIHMIRETVTEIKKSYPNIKTVGLLATSGTIKTKLYQDELEKRGIKIIVPEDEVIDEKVMKAIYGIKSRTDHQENEDLLAEAGQHVIDKGAELIVLGCTEIPLAFNPDRVDVPVVNATKVLAEKAIECYTQN